MKRGKFLGAVFAAALAAAVFLGGCGSQRGGKVEEALFDPPAGFVLYDEVDEMVMYTTADYPVDSSNFNMSWGTRSNINFDRYTAEAYRETMEKGMADAGMETVVSVDEIGKVEVNGVPALRIQSTYMLADMNFTCLQYIFAMDTDYIFTYTDVSTGEPTWLDAFEESVQTIEFVMA